ncbi:MAG: protein-glutamate O-methyltransferase CheR [Candidatus Verstraetearchaeota archaeon]|nr:protein-glutamate O-methyltransferase CheR [Candidatus Verstraetearchaeota archaeon]
MAEITRDELEAVLSTLASKGVPVRSYKPDFLRRRTLLRMAATKSKNAIEYIALLKRSPTEVRAFYDNISINVSEFFRDPPVWEGVAKAVRERVQEKLSSCLSPSLRIWSAGCSCGEEPYTIAIAVTEALRGTGISPSVASIYATDIDKDALSKAAKGVYTKEALKNVPEKLRGRYFEEADVDGERRYSVLGDIRGMVRFRQHNLVSDPPMLFFDMVFCRNLLIYFSQEIQRSVISKFSAALHKGGFLVLGMNEMIMFEDTGFEAYDPRNRIYRKALF